MLIKKNPDKNIGIWEILYVPTIDQLDGLSTCTSKGIMQGFFPLSSKYHNFIQDKNVWINAGSFLFSSYTPNAFINFLYNISIFKFTCKVQKVHKS